MKRYIAAAVLAMAAAICCSCSGEKQERERPSEAVTAAATEAPVTTTENVTAVVTTIATTSVTERVVTTAKSAEELSFTKEELYGLDPAQLCKDIGRRSGEHYEERYIESSDSYEGHIYRFSIDEDAQTAWITERKVDGHRMGEESFKYLNSAYCTDGRYGGSFTITDRWDHMPVSAIHIMGDVFFNYVPGPAVSEDDDFVITDERYRGDVKVACVSGSYIEKNLDRSEEVKRYYDKEIDLATGLTVYCATYDENGKLISVGQYNDLKFGDEAVPPMDQYQFRKYLDENCKPQLPVDSPTPDGLPMYEVSVFDSEIKRMPEVWKDIMSPENYEYFQKNGILN